MKVQFEDKISLWCFCADMFFFTKTHKNVGIFKEKVSYLVDIVTCVLLFCQNLENITSLSYELSKDSYRTTLLHQLIVESWYRKFGPNIGLNVPTVFLPLQKDISTKKKHIWPPKKTLSNSLPVPFYILNGFVQYRHKRLLERGFCWNWKVFSASFGF